MQGWDESLLWRYCWLLIRLRWSYQFSTCHLDINKVTSLTWIDKYWETFSTGIPKRISSTSFFGDINGIPSFHISEIGRLGSSWERQSLSGGFWKMKLQNGQPSRTPASSSWRLDQISNSTLTISWSGGICLHLEHALSLSWTTAMSWDPLKIKWDCRMIQGKPDFFYVHIALRRAGFSAAEAARSLICDILTRIQRNDWIRELQLDARKLQLKSMSAGGCAQHRQCCHLLTSTTSTGCHRLIHVLWTLVKESWPNSQILATFFPYSWFLAEMWSVVRSLN